MDQLNEAASDHERLGIMARWISCRLAAQPEADQLISWAVAEIERAAGRLRITDLVEQFGVTQKRFTRVFHHQVGVTPKTFSRIIRFRHLVHTLSTTEVPLQQAALTHCYHDQAHMNANFREYAGTSPRQFRAAQRFPGSQSIAA